jgi:thioredoxin reductase (NADPH)
VSRVSPTDGGLLDCVVVGAGPAGLTALTYLARFRRKVVALGGKGPRPRLTLIERSYNLPGYPEGIPGSVMLHRLREQAEENGGVILDAIARNVEMDGKRFKITLSEGEPLHCRKVILAMGIQDREPDVPGIAPHIGRFVRYCPICDGFEFSEKPLGIIGSGTSVARHALFLRTFSPEISIFLHGESPDGMGRYGQMLKGCRIEVFPDRITAILEEEGAEGRIGCGVRLEDGSERRLAVLYAALGCDLHLESVRRLPLQLDEDSFIITDIHQETSVHGVYAAGDIVSQINQIAVAFGQATIAAVHIHNTLDDEAGAIPDL